MDIKSSLNQALFISLNSQNYYPLKVSDPVRLFKCFRRNTFQLKRLQPTMLLREKRFDPDMFHNFNSLMDQAIHISPQAQCLQILSAGFIPSKSFNLRLPVFEIIFLPGNEVKNNLICDEYL